MEMSEEEKKIFLKERKEKLQAIIDNDNPEYDVPHMYEVEIVGDCADDGIAKARRPLTDREVEYAKITSPFNMRIKPIDKYCRKCRHIYDRVPDEELTDEDRAMIEEKKAEIAQTKEKMKELPELNKKITTSYAYDDIGSIKVKCRFMQLDLLGRGMSLETSVIDKKIAEISTKINEEKERKAMGRRKDESMSDFEDRKIYENRKHKFEQEIVEDRNNYQEGIDKTFEDDDPELDVPAYYNVLIGEIGDPRMIGEPEEMRKILTPRQIKYVENTRFLNSINFNNLKSSRYDYCHGIKDKIPEEELSQEEKDALAKRAEEIKQIKESKDYNKKGRMYIDRDFKTGIIHRNTYQTSVKITKGEYKLLDLDKSILEFKENSLSIDNIKRRIEEIKLERSAR